MKEFVYVYILVSQANEMIHYTGITRDLQQRLLEHNRGYMSTHGGTPAVANRNCDCIQIRDKGACVRKVLEKWLRTGICLASPLIFARSAAEKLHCGPRVCTAAASYAGALSCACGACAWQSLLSFVFSASPFRFSNSRVPIQPCNALRCN